MRLILVLFCLVLAIGLEAAGDCHKGSKYDAKAKKCICQSGYFGRTCSNRCKDYLHSEGTFVWDQFCLHKHLVWRDCVKSCSACSADGKRNENVFQDG
ncbi:uncharacterized protein LOC121389880 isoform X2 [Gigantopelta aegis]|uniref:uncharacterized protein LOC121389880 isoform X2 n=1 Tax=Gigantopelta aegis TaxID=1735272 RepID=UPI001B88D245|nr:uncharacterized protein LOC121389880 isoform X2 [Gigantopelta aegis]